MMVMNSICDFCQYQPKRGKLCPRASTVTQPCWVGDDEVLRIWEEREIEIPQFRCTTCGKIANLTWERWEDSCACDDLVKVTKVPSGMLMVLDEQGTVV